MKHPLPKLFAFCALSGSVGGQVEPVPFSDTPHNYWEMKPQDRLQRFMAAMPSLASSDERAFLRDMLKGLEVPESSQLLVFSATSFQSGIVNPRSPRALYFNDDTSVGFIPGGRLEVASFDPRGGMMFYIFDRLRGQSAGAVPAFVRSKSCINCHTDAMSAGRPGFVIGSVGVWWDGSQQETYRHDEIGHQVPLGKRFGGWHLTGRHQLTGSHANLVGNLSPSGFQGTKNEPGDHADISKYPRVTSDILAHLVHEHQCGFINRVTAAIYDHREHPADAAVVKRHAEALVSYVLFKDEAAVPKGLAGDPDFIRDFQARAPASPLRQFDLRTRLFRHRCSYMVETSVWQALPEPVRREAESLLSAAVAAVPSPMGQHLSAEERATIRPVIAALAENSAVRPSGGPPNQSSVPSGAGTQTQQTNKTHTPP